VRQEGEQDEGRDSDQDQRDVPEQSLLSTWIAGPLRDGTSRGLAVAHETSNVCVHPEKERVRAEEAYQHKGGHSLWSHYCLPRKIEPGQLYLGWCSACICVACAETRLLEMMITGPHRVRICVAHRPVLDLGQNCRGLIPTSPNSTARRQY
jgi:hypothetical protein